MKLTVVIPTLNEQTDLPATLESVKFADEILVVDSGSTDETVKIAKNFRAKVITHSFTDYASQRNFADQQALGDWILSIDADVVIPAPLAQEISLIISQDNYSFKAYYIGRQNEIWGSVVKHADWGPKDDCHVRLYRKGSGSWQSNVHEQFVTTSPTGKLKNYLYHLNYRTISEFIDKTDQYSSLSVDKQPISLWNAKYDFLKRYFYKLGFLDGLKGLFLCYLQSVYYLNLYIKQKTR